MIPQKPLRAALLLGLRGRRGRGWSGRLVASAGIHQVLEFFTGFEERNLFRGHFHAVSGLWVAADSGLRCRVRKLPKPRISILSPTRSERTMLSKIVSTITPLSLRVSSASQELRQSDQLLSWLRSLHNDLDLMPFSILPASAQLPYCKACPLREILRKLRMTPLRRRQIYFHR